MHPHTFLLYVLTEATLSLSPGPAVMLVVASGLIRGAARTVWTTLGILSANAIYFVLSASGLGSLLASSERLFLLVRIVGAAYLVILGLSALFGRPGPVSLRPRQSADTVSEGRWHLFRAALVLQLGNPKSLLFFVAILPQFIDPNQPVAAQMAWLAAGSMLPEFLILLAYAQLAGRARVVAMRPRFARWTERCAGGLILGAAALVVSARK